MKLTLPQVKAMEGLAKNNLSYSPGESLSFGNGEKVSWKVIRNLKKKGLVEGFDLHPWGPYPVYGICLTEAGKAMVKEWDVMAEQIIEDVLRMDKEKEWLKNGICFGA